MWDKLNPLNTVAVIKHCTNLRRKFVKDKVTSSMTSLFKNIFPFLGFLVVLVVLCNSTPIKENQEIPTKAKVGPHEDLKGRTIMKDGMNFMKDMFDFGSITWVPLGSLIFGNKDDIGFAKWPSNNNKN